MIEGDGAKVAHNDRPIESLDRDELIELVKQVLRENQELRRQLEEARRAAKRQAAPFSKGSPRTNPKTPGRKAGAHYGPRAHRPPLSRIDEHLEAPLPPRCPDCSGALEEIDTASQDQVEIPRRPIFRRFTIHIGRCVDCGRRVQGRHPLQTSDALGAAASQLGPDAKAVIATMNKDLGASYGKILGFFGKVFEISITRGGAAQTVLRTAERAKPIYQTILLIVRRSRRVTPDETGWKVGGILQWLWTFVARTVTAYRIRPSRGFDVAEEVLGAFYSGVLIHDGWAPYEKFGEAQHQQCLAHLLRRCQELLSTATRGAVRFPRELKTLLQSGLALRDRRDAGEVSARGMAVAIGRLESRLDRLLSGSFQNDENFRLANHVANHQRDIFTFLRRPGVDATNWRGEQAIRPAVVNRKVWGGNRTEAGAHAQEILVSILRTLAQRGADAIEFLNHVLRTPPGHALPVLPAFAGAWRSSTR